MAGNENRRATRWIPPVYLGATLTNRQISRLNPVHSLTCLNGRPSISLLNDAPAILHFQIVDKISRRNSRGMYDKFVFTL
jgi:hypothetical protein